jgi:hypothetical protein
LLKSLVWRAFSRAWLNTGNRIAARMAIIAMTTSNSIRVKPSRPFKRLKGFIMAHPSLMLYFCYLIAPQDERTMSWVGTFMCLGATGSPQISLKSISAA